VKRVVDEFVDDVEVGDARTDAICAAAEEGDDSRRDETQVRAAT
jgi:hypothetical protein